MVNDQQSKDLLDPGAEAVEDMPDAVPDTMIRRRSVRRRRIATAAASTAAVLAAVAVTTTAASHSPTGRGVELPAAGSPSGAPTDAVVIRDIPMTPELRVFQQDVAAELDVLYQFSEAKTGRPVPITDQELIAVAKTTGSSSSSTSGSPGPTRSRD